MKKHLARFQAALSARNAVKVIAGIANLDVDNVVSVARAADAAGAHAVDVAAHPGLIATVREVAPNATVFASSVDAAELVRAAEAGADVLELGNFDALYEQGVFLSAADVLARTETLIALLPAERPLLSITVPGHLSVDSQIQLATALQALGVEMIQTEGATRVLSAEPSAQTPNAAQKAEITLRNTRALVNAVSIPVMTASGIDADNVASAFEAGASAVGLGSFINKAADEATMVARTEAVMANRVRVLSKAV